MRITTPRRPRGHAAAALAGLIAAAALSAVPATAQADDTRADSRADDPVAPAFEPIWDHGPGGERYVSFGDSFVSGPGIVPQRENAACAQSGNNFPSIVARRLRVRSFTDASCGGARTVHYWEPQVRDGVTANPPQLDALSADTTLVTLGTMGGNDVGIVGLATQCVTGDCTQAAADVLPAIDALAPVYQDLIDDVAARAPEAEMLAISYGTYVPATVCPGLPGFDEAEAAGLQTAIDRMSDVLAEVAAANDVHFVDMREIPGVLDHTPCAAPEEQWIRGLNTYGDGAPLHPSSAGMRAQATQILHHLQADRGTEEKLAAAADTIDVAASCTGKAKRKRVVVEVSGGDGLVTRAGFHVGRQRVGVTESAPWRVRTKVADLNRRAATGSVRAVVTVRADGAKVRRTYATGRPGCIPQR